MSLSEDKTRKEIIDKKLLSSGWNIYDTRKVILEYEIEINDSLPDYFDRNKRFVDYVLLNSVGKIIAVVEAKRFDKSVGSAKTQAEYYARRIEKSQGFLPFIYITNGDTIEFWDKYLYPIREVSGFHSFEDLERLQNLYEKGFELSPNFIDKSISSRYYQIEAITKGLSKLKTGKRELLFVMATGTGKTRTIISFIKTLLKDNFIQRVLFLADRNGLVDQALGDFKDYLPSESKEKISSKDFEAEKRIYVSTYQTMMSIIKNKNLSIGFFDLIVADESHRSIYNYYGDIFKKFDAIKVGLTATPVDFIDRNTYKFFGLNDGKPDFAYSYEEAVKDGYLSTYDVISVNTKFQRDGINFENISPEEIEDLKNRDIEELEFSGKSIERAVINDDTNREILKYFMENCFRHPISNLPAKTIIFAINKDHAYRLAKHFDELFPQYKSEVAKVIVSEMNNSSELIKEFKSPKSRFNVAISVDMLDTGIDVPSIMNLLFLKPVFSRTKFWQMIGRGTRLYNEEFKKEKFYIFDFWNNFEYFNLKPEGKTPPKNRGLFQRLYEENLNLYKNVNGKEREKIKVELQNSINSLPEKDIFVKSRSVDLRKIDFENIESLEKISSLMDRVEISEPKELQFRIKLRKIQNCRISGDKNELENLINSILKDIDQLKRNSTISVVKNVSNDLEKLSSGNYIYNLSFDEISEIMEKIAPLMKYRSNLEVEIPHFDLKDEIVSEKKIVINHKSLDLSVYQEEIKKSVYELLQKSEILQKIWKNEKLSGGDLSDFEKELNDRNLKIDILRDVYKSQFIDIIDIFRDIINRRENSLILSLNRFIEKYSLQQDQIDFINAVKLYISEKGDILKSDFQKSYFMDFHKIAIMKMVQEKPMLEEFFEIIENGYIKQEKEFRS